MKGITLLLVDDSELVLHFLTKILSDQGFTILAAKNLPQAVSFASRNAPHAMVCDFILEGGCTGLELASAVSAVAPKLPMMLMTHGPLDKEDADTAALKSIPVVQKPKKGGESEFVDSVKYWLKDVKIIK